MSLTIDVVANEIECDPGLIVHHLGDYDPQIQFRSREDPGSWNSEVKADIVLHLGSSWSVYWSDISKNVAAEAALVRHAVGRGTPVLGVCFGAQMLSHAFGGRVERGKKTEIGWHDVVATDSGAPLGGRWMQWHYDSFTCPPGFDTLAINDAGIQAIRRGRALGVQFHPEATEAIVTRWIEGGGAVELATYGLSPSELLAETRRESGRSVVAARDLVQWFLETVAQGRADERSNN